MIVQESNTFTPKASDIDSFASQGLWLGSDAARRSAGTNTEIAGALTTLSIAGYEAVPLIRAWAMSGGVLQDATLDRLSDLLAEAIRGAGPLDGLVLSLHGALVAERTPDADSHLVEVARRSLGSSVPIVISLDLHANVTKRLVEAVDGVVGFRTYPHVDQGETGARAARMLDHVLRNGELSTSMRKLPMLVPAEAQGTANEPMRSLRAAADLAMAERDVLDVSLFPVQPWLDIPELGFAVTVVAQTSGRASTVADEIGTQCWTARRNFSVDLVSVPQAIENALSNTTGRPAVLVHSSDSPTSGCTADSPAVLAHIEQSEHHFTSAVAVVDEQAVAICMKLADDSRPLTLAVGASLNATWDVPVRVSGVLHSRGDAPVTLAGPSMTGQEVNLGNWCVVRTARDTYVLLSERPAPTFDPATWSTTRVPFEDLDIVSVRSANMFRAGYGDLIGPSFLLDLPGASTPNLKHLTFTHGAQTLFPFDDLRSLP